MVGEAVCDSYTILVTNAGSRASDGSTITISDVLPEGVTATGIVGRDWSQNSIGEPLVCTTVPLRCTDERPIAPDGTIEVTIEVEVGSATGAVTNQVSVAGGGVAPTSIGVQNTIGVGTAPFGLQGLGFETTGPDGSLDVRAGGHPYEQTTSIGITTRVAPGLGNSLEDPYQSTEEPKDIVVYLPPGFVGDPQVTPRCPLTLLEQTEFDSNPASQTFGDLLPKCPSGSRIGVVRFASAIFGFTGSSKTFGFATSVFNVVTEGNHPAELGFRFQDKAILVYADLVHTSAGYRLRATVPGIPLIGYYYTALTLFGQPGAHDGEPSATGSFITNPTRCTNEPLTTKIEADSWVEPTHWVSGETVAYPHVEGCNLLQFNPEIQVHPETTQADTPSGYEVDLKIPRAATPQGVLQAPELRDATIALPAGVSVSPSAADGLEGCEATGPNGIDIPHGMAHADEAGEGEAIGPAGLSYLTPGHCPLKSRIAEVELETPLLPHPLKGHLFLAQPKCGGVGQPECTQADARNGNLFGLYLEVGGEPGEEAGVVVKLAGTVSADPVTGQLTASFMENPQLPFSELRVRLNSGVRAPLSNPQGCGTFTTTSDLVPWSTPVTPDATPSSSFEVPGCASPFSPSFTAGTVTPLAGGSSPFTLTLSRHDGEQDLSGVGVSTPPGLLGMLSQVQLCPEPQASNGTCGPQSLIGHTQVAAGAGSHPFWEPGAVYLTGPYKGQPFGLSIVTRAQAGPFTLGNVIVRAAIHVDPGTSALTVTSDPLPQIIDGVPLRIQTVNVTIDKQGFMLNPTNCSQQQITGTITSAQGASANVSSPFAVAGCKGLPFNPVFSASTQSRTSKANGASLVVRVAQKPGEANIHKVDLQLPLILPARLTTLQKACTEAQFGANPAGCPSASVIGTATAITPVLSVPLTGPAYLVSHGGAAFPDVEFVLQGQGVTVVLDGGTDIKKGITYSRFETVPDAPISSFETVLPEGPHSALTANGDLCSQTRVVTVRKRVVRRVHGHARRVLRSVREVTAPSLSMPTTITGQNGAQIRQATKIEVTGCARHKAKKRARHRVKGKRK
jgi:uncharacterized repeat protein (TIGR01451 family)